MSTNPTPISYIFSSEILIKTCPLPSSMIISKGLRRHRNAHNKLSTVTVSASKIEPLSALLKRHKKHLEYNVMEHLIESIGRQLQSLEYENKAISNFNLDDITVFHDINNPDILYFAITNDEKIHDINESNNIVITTPYSSTASGSMKASSPSFHSPEFKEFLAKKKLPYEIHFKSGYYSFGLLCMYCYVSRSSALLATSTSTSTPVDSIINTKIYWFLKQVLRENPTERRYICA